MLENGRSGIKRSKKLLSPLGGRTMKLFERDSSNWVSLSVRKYPWKSWPRAKDNPNWWGANGSVSLLLFHHLRFPYPLAGGSAHPPRCTDWEECPPSLLRNVTFFGRKRRGETLPPRAVRFEITILAIEEAKRRKKNERKKERKKKCETKFFKLVLYSILSLFLARIFISIIFFEPSREAAPFLLAHKFR